MCKSVNILVFWSYQCCAGALSCNVSNHRIAHMSSFMVSRLVSARDLRGRTALVFVHVINEIGRVALAFDPIRTCIRGFDEVQHKNSSIYREKGKAKDHGAGSKKGGKIVTN